MNLSKNNFRMAFYGASDVAKRSVLKKSFLLGYVHNDL